MDNIDANKDNNDFILQLRTRAQQKAKEMVELTHEKKRIDVHIQRTKAYIEQLNSFLEAEGQAPVSLKEQNTRVGKSGNRAKGLPVRKLEWEGMSMNEIIQRILDKSPNIVYHPKEVAPLIYEIKSDSDLSMVYKNVRTTMQRGAREERWKKIGRAKFKSSISAS